MKNQKVFVAGTGVGVVLEEIAEMILVQFEKCCAWIDLRFEKVEVTA